MINGKDLIQIQTVEQHKIIKNQFLNYFDRIKAPRKIGTSDDIINTDYGIDMNREYLNLFTTEILPLTYNKDYRVTQVHNVWFQQYAQNNYHNWHIHGPCHFSHIYFIELPSKGVATEFYWNKLIKLNVKEGDLISFPAYMVHRSPVNKNKKRKTILSFNTTFDEVMVPNLKLN